MFARRRHRFALFEENIEPYYDSSNFPVLFLTKIIVNRVMLHIF